MTSANLTPASGCQDHTTSPYASRRIRLARRKRPSHPAPNVRDDRDTPLLWVQDAGISAADLPDGTTGIFFLMGLDDPNHVESAYEFGALAHALLRALVPASDATVLEIDLI